MFEHEETAVVLSAIGAQCGKTWIAEGRWTPIKNTIWFKAEKSITTRFIYLFTGDPKIWPKRGQAQPFIALGDVRTLKISLPPLSEQRRIVDLVGAIDACIDALEVQVEADRIARAGVLAELLSGEHRLPESYDKFVEAS